MILAKRLARRGFAAASVAAALAGGAAPAPAELVASTVRAATGGVAANNELRRIFEEQSARASLPVFFPSRPLSTDNAAMIAAAAYPKFLAGDFARMDFCAEAGMALR